MYRVTTPDNVFTLPEDATSYKVIQISWKQGSRMLTKTIKDGIIPSGITVSGAVVSVMLTQEETKQFKAGELLVQVRALTNGGKALASKRFPIQVEAVNNEEILK